MNTKEVCRQLNVTPKMLRIYEEQKLISPQRKENNYRDYSLDDLMQIKVIMTLRNLGFSLNETLSILSHAEKTKNEYLYSFYIQLKAVDGKIRELREIEKKLGKKINRIMAEIDSNDIEKASLSKIEAVILEEDPENQQISGYDSLIRQWDFDEMAADYSNRFLQNDQVYQRGIVRIREILLPAVSGKKVVDVGCGTCNLWEGFPSDVDLTATDFSLPMLLAGKKNIPWAVMKWSDILDDVTQPEEYDIVVATFVLHHIQRPYQKIALENMKKLCRKGGHIYIMEKSYDGREAFENKKKQLKGENNTKELEILNSEFALFKEETVSYLNCLDLEVKTESLEGDICGYYINLF